MFSVASIIQAYLWSLGSKLVTDQTLKACHEWVKAEDPSRAVQFQMKEQALTEKRIFIVRCITDIKDCGGICKNPDSPKPLIQCICSCDGYSKVVLRSIGFDSQISGIIREVLFGIFVDQSIPLDRKRR